METWWLMTFFLSTLPERISSSAARTRQESRAPGTEHGDPFSAPSRNGRPPGGCSKTATTTTFPFLSGHGNRLLLVPGVPGGILWSGRRSHRQHPAHSCRRAAIRDNISVPVKALTFFQGIFPGSVYNGISAKIPSRVEPSVSKDRLTIVLTSALAFSTCKTPSPIMPGSYNHVCLALHRNEPG